MRASSTKSARSASRVCLSMNSRSGGAPRSSAVVTSIWPAIAGWIASSLMRRRRRRHDERRQKQRQADDHLVRRHFLRADRLPQEVEDDRDARERRHHHQRRRHERQQRQQDDDLERRGDRADAVDLHVEIRRRRGGCAAPQRLRGRRHARGAAHRIDGDAPDDERARTGRATSRASWLHLRRPWRSLGDGRRMARAGVCSSVTSDTWSGARPTSSRRPSTVTITSDRRSPSGSAVSTPSAPLVRLSSTPRRSSHARPTSSASTTRSAEPSSARRAARGRARRPARRPERERTSDIMPRQPPGGRMRLSRRPRFSSTITTSPAATARRRRGARGRRRPAA